MNNKKLYNSIIINISKSIKNTLLETIDYDGYEYDDTNDIIAMNRLKQNDSILKDKIKRTESFFKSGYENPYLLLMRNEGKFYTIATEEVYNKYKLYRKGWGVIGEFDIYSDAWDNYEQCIEPNEFIEISKVLCNLRERKNISYRKVLNENYYEDQDLIYQLFNYTKENYPSVADKLDELLETYENGVNISIIIQSFKDIISDFDTIVFNNEGIPNIYDSIDIELASLLEKIIYIY